MTNIADSPSSQTPTSTDAVGDGGPVGAVRALLVAAGAGAAVSLSLGVYATRHEPTFHGIFAFGFPAVLPMKAWFTTIAAALALLQLGSALWMWGRLPIHAAAPAWIGAAHRWLGTAAFVFTLPVAYHCLWALGFNDTDVRVLAHSLLGCLFYGIFTSKMLLLRSERAPGWSLPVAGGLLFTVLVALWMTSSLWWFSTSGFPGV